MEILKFPHPALLTPCKPVTVFGLELKVMLDSMFETMVQNNGIGLAANQVGLDYRMFVMLGINGGCCYIINPEIISKSNIISNFQEGCLSSPGEKITTNNRSIWVRIKFQDIQGDSIIFTFEGIHAICVQHEIEHLEGKSFLQSEAISKSKRVALCKKWGLKVK